MLDDDHKGRLQTWIGERLNKPHLMIDLVQPLGGGSIQENWRIDCCLGGDQRQFVLRKDAPATIASSRPREQEFAILEQAYRAGVRTPEPIGFCNDPAVVGAPFALMGLANGIGLGPRIVKDQTLGGDRDQLGRQLGKELARIHSILPPRSELAFLGTPNATPAQAEVDALRAALDQLGEKRPSIEWGLRWAERTAPVSKRITLVHRDFRTGNYMVDGNGLTAVLDWEFAGWGDALSDIGWFCAECWRFGRPDLEAGGITSREAFYAGYEAESCATVDDEAVRYWEVVAHLRWAVIALEQGHRHLSGLEPSLELALTGRIAPEIERAILRATAPQTWKTIDA